MIRLLIIADDFTGALDTGVQMAGNGASTTVTTDRHCSFSNYESTEVLVIDAETRHLPPKEAGDIVRDIVHRAMISKIPHLYKKTDSALRGNVGAELTAMLEASGETVLPFLPALPQIHRVTRNGVHYIDGIPVADSVFGKDPFEPVVHSVVPELIAEQSSVPVHSISIREDTQELQQGITVFDIETQKEMEYAGKFLAETEMLRISAGSSGFGAVLPELLGLCRNRVDRPHLESRLLVICGSVNPITVEQTEIAHQAGFTHWRLKPDQKLDEDYWQSEEGKRTLDELGELLSKSPTMIIDSNDEGGNTPTEQYAAEKGLDMENVRVGISRALGNIMAELFTNPALGVLLITGGDTLYQCMNQIGVSELEPICELYTGVVLSRFNYRNCSRYVLSKSGGFGQKTLFIDLFQILQNQSFDNKKGGLS